MAKKTEVKKWPKPEIKGDQLKEVLAYRAKRELEEGSPIGFTDAIRELIAKGLKV